MRIIFSLLLVLVIGMPLCGQQGSVYQRVAVDLTTGDESLFRKSGMDLEHGTYIPGKLYINDLATWETDRLRQLGFEVKVLIEDVTLYYAEQSSTRSQVLGCQQPDHGYGIPANFHLGSMGGYLTYPELLDELDLMALKYPNLITSRSQVGEELTHQGREIVWVRISDNANTDENEPEILYTALHHAREPMSMMQMVYYMWYLLEEYSSNAEVKFLVNNTEMYFIPCVNPDGYIYNQAIAPDGGGGWRKNMRDNNGDGLFNETEDGVDLNRNYAFQWAFDEEGSSSAEGAVTYRGPEPFSEPETRAMRDFVNDHDFALALNYHSYGNFLLYPWGFDGNNSPDSTVFNNYVEILTSESRYGHGTTESALGYLANGVASDWMYAAHDVIAITPEVGHEQHGFWPPSEEIIPYCQNTFFKNLALAHLTQTYAVASYSKNQFIEDEGTLAVSVKRYGIAPGSIAMAIESLDDEFVIESSIQEVGFEMFEEEVYEFGYFLKNTGEQGETYRLVVSVDNGFYEKKDTLEFVYLTRDNLLSDMGITMDNWELEAGATWGITNEEASSGESSFTDSPYEHYSKNSVNSIVISEPFDLSEAISAELRFDAKWEIEDVIDYAIVEASIDGSNFIPLCGQYSTPGSIFQLTGEPVYDGIQHTWIRERIDLSQFAGEQVFIRFSMISDVFYELDGIYIDDIEVVMFLIDETTSTIKLDQADFTFSQYPNPATSDFTIRTDLSELNFTSGKLEVFDLLGNRLYIQEIEPGQGDYTIPSATWPAGIYTSVLSIDGSRIRTGKVVIVE